MNEAAINHEKPSSAEPRRRINCYYDSSSHLLDRNKRNSIWGAPNPNLSDGTFHLWLTTSGPELVARGTPGIFSLYTKAQWDADKILIAKQQRDALSTDDGAKQYVQQFYTAAGSQAIVESCSAFVPKLVGDNHFLLAKAVIRPPEGLAKATVGIVTQVDNDDKLSSYIEAMDENKFYEFVTTGNTALLHKAENLDVNAKPTSTPTPEAALAPTVNRDNERERGI